MVLPIGVEDDFIGVVDLLSRKAHIWPDPGNPEKFELQDVPEDMVDLVEEWREKLIETAVEQDDDLMESYLEGEEPSIDDIKRCIRKGTIALELPDLLRLCVQGQGHSVSTRCGGGFPA